VVPDAGERARMKAAAKAAAPRDSKELINWLDGK
jgi:hypothetical protein